MILQQSDLEGSHEVESYLKRARLPRRTSEMTAFQASTDSYAIVPESVIEAKQGNVARFVVEEDGTNAIDARVVGRNYDGAGNASAWVPAAGSNAEKTAISGESVVIFPDDVAFDDLGVQITANSAGNQGDAKVKGVVRRV